MGFNWSEIFVHMGWPALIVAGVLLVMGLASLTVFVERVMNIRRSRAASRQFAAEIADDLSAAVFERVVETAERYDRGYLPKLVRTGLQTYLHARAHDDGSGLPPLERSRRHVDRKLEELGAEMRRGLPVLASVGSVAPFVGLLGTVLGIITAFQGIAATGSGGLSSVSAGIAEALIETAFGLAVAIPAVLAFNYLSTEIGRDELTLTTAGGELLDTLEHFAEAEVERTGRRSTLREQVAHA